MKKLMTLIIVLLLIAFAWGGANWFIGQKTEEIFKQQLQASNERTKMQGVTQTLVSYEKNFLGAKAVWDVELGDVAMPFSENAPERIRLKADIHNGPILWGERGVKPGLSRWHMVMDEEAIEEAEIRGMLKEAFQGKTPFEFWIDVNYDRSSDVEALVNPIKWLTEQGELTLSESRIKGHQKDIQQVEGAAQATINMGALDIVSDDLTFKLPASEMNLNITEVTGGTMLGTADYTVSGVEVMPASMAAPIRFDLALNSDTEREGDTLKGMMKMRAQNLKGLEGQVTAADYQMRFTGMREEGFIEVSRLQGELQNVQSQIAWNDEALSTPEGQKQMNEMFTRIQALTGEIMDTLFTKTLQNGQSNITQNLLLSGDNGKLQADVDLTYNNQGDVPDMTSLMLYTPEQWVAMLQGDIKVTTDQAFLPPMAPLILAGPVGQGAIVADSEQFNIDLKLLGDTVNLNGEVMTFTEMVARFMPPALEQSAAPAESATPETALEENATDKAASMSGGLGLPEDIMQQIEEEGFTPEVLQMIEESDDISDEARAVLKQLQEMEAAGLIAPESEMPKEAEGETKLDLETEPESESESEVLKPITAE